MANAEKQFSGGMIQKVSGSDQAITISTSEESVDAKGVNMPAGTVMTLMIDEDTTITVNRDYRSFNELAAGQKLKSVYFVEGSGSSTATVLHVVDEAAMQEKSAQPEEEAATEESKPKI